MSIFVQQEIALSEPGDVLTHCKMRDIVAYRDGNGELKQGRVDGWRLVNFGTIHAHHAALVRLSEWRDRIVPTSAIVAKVIVKR